MLLPITAPALGSIALVALATLDQGGADASLDLPQRIAALEALPAADRPTAAGELWSDLAASGQIPWVSNQTAVFLHRGPAQRVAAAGDFNGWSDQRTPLAPVVGTDLWWATVELPRDARVDYKLVIDGAWVLDPANPAQQWSGFGPNSELAMPDYVPSEWIEPIEGAPRGTTGAEHTFESEHLGREVVYRVHEPAPELRGDAPLAVLFVTDGHEYLDPRLGALAVVHDNLLASGRIRPVLLVLVDPRSAGQNLRARELAADPRLGRALTSELLPLLERDYDLTEHAEQRGILGTSLGGVAAAMICARHRETIGLALIQSPALRHAPDAVEQVLRPENLPARAFLSWGTINDGGDRARELERTYRERGAELTAVERSEGHSWGQWSALLDDALAATFPSDVEVGPAAED